MEGFSQYSQTLAVMVGRGTPSLVAGGLIRPGLAFLALKAVFAGG